MSNLLTEKELAAVAAMRIQINKDGNGLVALTPEGILLPPNKMTPEQQVAFQKYEKLVCPPKPVVADTE